MSGLPPGSSSSTALVTGASSGIGIDLARELSQRGHHVTLVARREERLRELAAELGANPASPGADAVPCDLADSAARAGLVDRLLASGRDVAVLVNNAGFGIRGRLARSDPERQVEMVRLNVEAVTDLCARLSTPMAERASGAILNVASTAAFQPLPGLAVYAATKAFVLSLSEALHTELDPHGVVVTALCPGPVRTEFVEVADIGEFQSSTPDVMWSDPHEVARDGIEGLERGKRVVVSGTLNRVVAAGGRFSPRGLQLRLTRSLYGRR